MPDYKKVSFLFLLFCTTLISSIVGQANISGVINDYKAVTSIDDATGTLQVSNTTGLNVGDTVLLIQMQGALINTTNSAAYGNVLVYNGAGDHEYNTICEINGNAITFMKYFAHDYDVGGNVQLVTIPRYQDAVVTADLTCQPWNGSTGGVLIVWVDGTLTLNADINVNGMGFRGGNHFESLYQCLFFDNFNDYSYTVASGFGAEKGEGSANYLPADGGRGPAGNGGGGGNDHNSGGGGGGNASRGGHGGDNDEPSSFGCDGYHPGIGGQDMDYTIDHRKFMGGGGGAGHSNSQWNSSGGNGGGLAFVVVNNFNGNGFTIRADGDDGLSGFGDGAGGGGAGGTVVMEITNYTGNVNIQAIGGDGADSDGFTSDRCFGPGGGGAGGVITFNQGSAPAQATTYLSGGTNGVVGNSTNPCQGLAQNATPGDFGNIYTNNSIPTGSKGNNFCSLVAQVDLGNDTTLCSGQGLILDAGNPGATFNWSTGATSQTITATTSGIYWVEVDDGVCPVCDTIVVTFNAPFNIDLGADQNVCEGTTVVLDAGTGPSSYSWSTGETVQAIGVTTSGTWIVEGWNGNCYDTDTVTINVYPVPDTLSESLLYICDQPTVTLDAENPGFTYAWNTGETTSTIEVNTPGTYQVLITNGVCGIAESIVVEHCGNNLDIPNTITPNGDGKNDTWILPGIYGYPGNKVEIFNRNGNSVYSATNYNNDWNGDNLPATTYYYIVDLNNGGNLLNGTVTILRE